MSQSGCGPVETGLTIGEGVRDACAPPDFLHDPRKRIVGVDCPSSYELGQIADLANVDRMPAILLSTNHVCQRYTQSQDCPICVGKISGDLINFRTLAVILIFTSMVLNDLNRQVWSRTEGSWQSRSDFR